MARRIKARSNRICPQSRIDCAVILMDRGGPTEEVLAEMRNGNGRTALGGENRFSCPKSKNPIRGAPFVANGIHPLERFTSASE
jgi:hypothetical protein